MLIDILKSRRSIRKFQDKEIEKEKIDILLKSALLSPSSRARKPWSFIAVADKEQLKKLSQCRGISSSFLSGAPLGVVVLADETVSDVWVEDASIASIILQLSAHSIGLGSCWIQVRERQHSNDVKADTYIREVLGIPEKYNVECIIAVGYSGEEKDPYDENKVSFDKIHYDKY